jgi:naphthoate synthase
LVNKVVEPKELMNAAREWASKVSALSPTAIKTLKHSFNADSDHIIGIQSIAFDVLDLYTQTDEAKEGGIAFTEKRSPNFSKFQEN